MLLSILGLAPFDDEGDGGPGGARGGAAGGGGGAGGGAAAAAGAGGADRGRHVSCNPVVFLKLVCMYVMFVFILVMGGRAGGVLV